MHTALWTLLVVACQVPDPVPVTEIGNPERNIGFAAQILPDPVDPSIITSAWGGFGGTKLVLDERYAGENELEWETPEVVADLLAGPVELKFKSPNAAYNRVIVRPRDGRSGPANAPPELKDGAFVVEGVRGDGTPFLLVDDYDGEFDLVGAYDLGKDQTHLALGFAVDQWITEQDLAGATIQGGSITIDRDHNAGLLSAFEAGLPETVTLADDLDQDGEVGDGDVVLIGQ